MELTLEQLKQQNAQEEAAANETKIEKEAIKDEYVEVDENLEAVDTETEIKPTDETDDSEGVIKEEVETELWMQGEEQNSSSEEKFDSSQMASLRRKMKAKALEAEAAHEKEMAELRKELELIKAGNNTVKPTQTTARPKLEDFDYDEEKYGEALDSYLINKMSAQTNEAATRQQQEAQQQLIANEQQKKLDSHYEQAQELIASKVITPDAYQNSETVFRQSLDAIAPGNGDGLAEELIARLTTLGEGSAKVIYHLGRNSANRDRVTKALASDPSGLTAMGILGEIKAKLTSAPAKKISSAPAPSAALKGGEVAGSSEAKLLRKYKEAHRSGNSQAAFDAKQEAKSAGINTRNWS